MKTMLNFHFSGEWFEEYLGGTKRCFRRITMQNKNLEPSIDEAAMRAVASMKEQEKSEEFIVKTLVSLLGLNKNEAIEYYRKSFREP